MMIPLQMFLHRSMLCAGVVALTGLSVLAQQPSPEQPKPPTRQELEQAIQLIQRSVDGQRQRCQVARDKLKATDDQIEQRVARLVESLTPLADSPESGSKILLAKETLMDGLKKSLETYVRERDTRMAELYRQTTRIGKADLLDDVTRLNQRIEKRVQQILAVTMSLPIQRDVPQIIQTYYGDGVTTQANPEYTHYKTQASRAAQIRKKVQDGLKASLDKIQRANNELERNKQYVRSEWGQKATDDLIQRNQQLLEQRRADIMRISTDAAPGSRTMAGRAADEVARQVQAERTEARKDDSEWNRLKNDFDNERARLQEYEARLANYQRALDQSGK